MGSPASNELIYFVSGMWCSTCANSVRESVLSLEGVDSAQINYASKLLKVKTCVDLELVVGLDDSIQKKVSRIGFGIKKQSGDWILRFHDALAKEANQKLTWTEVSLVWFLAMWSAMFAFSGYLGGLSEKEIYFVSVASAAFGIPAILIGIRFYATSGLRALWFSRILTLDLFIFLGAIAVLVVTTGSIVSGRLDSYADSGSMILAILLLAKKIENSVTTKITSSILFQLHPSLNNTLTLKESGWKAADVSQIRRGDLIQVREGETIPLDGTLESQSASSNNHLMSGESAKISMKRGDDIFAGAIACTTMRIRVSAPLGERKIDAWAERALVSDSNVGRYERIFQKIESRLVKASFFGAVLIAAASMWRGESAWRVTESFFVGVLVFCPCLFASILPLAKQMAYLGLLKKGILISRLEALLDLKSVRHFYFDKTGTLEAIESTYVSFENDSDNAVMPFLSALAAKSQHVILRELTSLTRELGPLLQLEKIEEHANKGVVAWDQHANKIVVGRATFLVQQHVQMDKGVDPELSYVGLNGKLMGQILTKRLYDLRSVNFLKTLLGLVPNAQIEILSGDPSKTRSEMYTSIDGRIEYRGDLSPEAKSGFVKANSAFVGDGLNDTLALSKAQVSFRLGQRVKGFAPVDFYLQRPDLNLITFALQYSKKYRQVLIQTVCFALLYNVVTLSLALLGKFSPLGAAVAMLSSFTLMLLSILRLQNVNGFRT